MFTRWPAAIILSVRKVLSRNGRRFTVRNRCCRSAARTTRRSWKISESRIWIGIENETWSLWRLVRPGSPRASARRAGGGRGTWPGPVVFHSRRQSPFKPERPPASAAVRLQLLRLALVGKTNYEVDELEIQRGGVSYTVDTLREYARRFPAAEIFYLIGADNAAKLNEWRESVELAGLAEFVAVPRPGGAMAVFPPPFHGRTLKGFPFDVSSSQIRARLKAGLPVENLVPPFVAEAIRNTRLYI